MSQALPSADAMHARLQAQLAPRQLEVIDESSQHAGHSGSNGLGHGTHFRVRVDSPLFAGKPRVAQHRLVYDALRSFIEQGVHAIAIEVIAPPGASAGIPNGRTLNDDPLLPADLAAKPHL